jgi:hypothetical protein
MIFTNTVVGGWNVYRRAAGAVDPANPLAGVWVRDQESTDSRGAHPALVIAAEKTDGVTLALGSRAVYAAHFDGKPYPTDQTGVTVSLKLVGRHTVEETYRRGRKVVDTVVCVVSDDSHRMTVTRDGILVTGARFYDVTTWEK